jgi:hypothetical protein
MSRTRSRVLIILTVIGLMAGLAQISGSTSARAQAVILSTPVCDGSNYCINDWYDGGDGNPVRMFTNQSSVNEDFVVLQLDDRCGGNVTTTCPFHNTQFDDAFYGDPVVEVLDTYQSMCLSTNTDGTAVLGVCPIDGSGGSPGNIYVYDYSTGELLSNYWTNEDDTVKCEGDTGEYDGATMYLYFAYGYCTSWIS